MTRRRDNFGALRLAAATAVLVSHSFGLTGRADPVRAMAGQDLGPIAVAVFFAISGYLVMGSWSRDANVLRFAKRRIRRIWPGLTVAVLFTAYVVGPLFTKLPVGAYLGSSGPHGYALDKVLMLPADHLPGVFASNPLVTANGSLWTLPIEVKAYLILAAAGLVGALRRRWFLWAAWLVCVEVVVVSGVYDLAAALGIWPQELFLFAVFLGGAALYQERDRVPLRGSFAAALVAAWLLTRGTHMQVPLGAAAFPYVCVWLAYRTRPVLARLVERADLSYGIYLYSYPVEQGIRAALGPSATPAVLVALGLPITAMLAFLSWTLVEKRWLARRPKEVAPPVEPAVEIPPLAPDYLPAGRNAQT